MKTKYTFFWVITLFLFGNPIIGQELIKDINIGSNSSSPSNLMSYEDKLYFSAKTNSEGNELWVLDKRHTEIKMLLDIYSGSADASPSNLTVYQDKLYFSATDISGRELWISDGTEAGTKLLKNIQTGSASSSPSNFLVFDDKLYFSANDGSNGRELWVTDGTETGTKMLKNIGSNSLSSSPENLTIFNNKLYFSASDGSNGTELWATDGTENGTKLIKEIHTSGSSNPANFIVFQDKLYFSASDNSNGRELWVTDGTENGTKLIKNINSNSSNSNPSNFVLHQNKLYFSATNVSNGNELWVTDGTELGTKLVKDIYSGATGSNPSNFISYFDNLYFVADNPVSGRELWETDGTEEKTKIVYDIQTGSGDANPSNLVIYDGKLYFVAEGNTSGNELWATGGTEDQTELLSDLNYGSSDSSPSEFTIFKGRLYYSAFDGINGRELRQYTFSETPNIVLKQDRLTLENGNTTFDFGTINEGESSASMTFTIENTRDFDLEIGDFEINGLDAGLFTTVSTNFSKTIEGLETASFTITFSPNSTGFKTAFLTIGSNDPDAETYTFTLVGEGKDASPKINLKQGTTPILSGTKGLDFGEVRTDEMSLPIAFTIENTGIRDLDLTNFQITGADSEYFTSVSWTTATITGEGGKTNFSLQFAPKTIGFKTAFITIRNTDSTKNPYTFLVNGRGVIPDIQLLQDLTEIPNQTGIYDFGTVRSTENSPEITFTIKNTGTADLKLMGFEMNGENPDNFITSSWLTTEISAEGLTKYTVFTVKFKPTSLGFKTAFLTISSDDPDENPYTFSVIGFSIDPDIYVQTNSTELPNLGIYDFGEVSTQFSKDIFITISNVGNDDLNLTNFTTTGTNKDVFATASWKNSMITAGGSTFMTVRFSPISVGFQTAFMSISSNDPDENPYIIQLQGTGVSAFPIAKLRLKDNTEIANGGTYDFGAFDTASGSAFSTVFITVHNEGTANLFISSFTTSGLDANLFKTTSFVTAMITVNGGVGFGITFLPTDNNFKTAFITIQTNDPNTNPYIVRLVGQGKNPEPDINLIYSTISVLNGGTFDFGEVGMSSSATQFMTIQNVGSADLLLNFLTFSGTEAVHFSTSTSWAMTTVSQGNNTSFELKFEPNGLGFRTAFLTIQNNDSDESAYVIKLVGEGKGSEIQVKNSFTTIPDKSVVDLGKFDKTLNNSVFITVKNIGLGDLELNFFTITGVDADLFSTVTSWSKFVTAGTFTSVELQFASATTEGFKTAFVTIGSNEPNKPNYYFTIYASHVGSEILVQNNFTTIPNQTGNYTFSEISIGNDNTAFLTVENVGMSDLNLNFLTITGTDADLFSTVTWGTNTLAGGTNTGFELKFTPTGTVGFKTAFITIYNDDLDKNPYLFTIYGKTKSSAPDIEIIGNQFISSLTGSYDFGTVNVSSGNRQAFITIRNTGAESLNISFTSITGTDALMFTTTTWGQAMITANDMTFLTVTFDPSSIGFKTAFITISSNDLDENPYIFAVTGQGVAPEISLQSETGEILSQTGSYNFGAFNTISSGETFMTIKNEGDFDLNLNSFAINGTDATMFTTTSWTNSMITAGGMTFMSVKFTPTSAGFKTAFITIGNDDLDENPFTFTVFGFGKNSDPDMEVYRDFISIPNLTGSTDFGTADIVKNDFQDVIIEIKNTGIGNLELMTFSITGVDASMFTTTTSFYNNFTTINLAGNTLITASGNNSSGNTFFTIRFLPTSEGFKTAYINIQNNDPDTNPYIFAVTGEGVAPDIQVRKDTEIIEHLTGNYDFGEVSVGLSRIIFLTVENVGKIDLHLQNFAFSGANPTDFVTTPWAITTIPSNHGYTTFAVEFEPKSQGNKIATVEIGSDDPDENPYIFRLQGFGKSPDILVKKGSEIIPNQTGKHDFENAVIGQNKILFITVENTEITPLDLSNLEITGADASMFETTLWANSQVQGMSKTTFSVIFKPSSIGFKTAFITISSNDPDENPYTFTVLGIGENPAPNIHLKQKNTDLVNNSTFEFPSVNTVSSNGNVIFTIENQGVDNLNITNFELSGVNATHFKLKKSPLTTIAGQTETTFEIEFLPTSEGFKTAQIVIENNAPDENPYVLMLIGEGTIPPPVEGAFTPEPETEIEPEPSGRFSMRAMIAGETVILRSKDTVDLATTLKVGVQFLIDAPESQIILAYPNMYYSLEDDNRTTKMTPTQAGTYILTLKNKNYREFKVEVTVAKGEQTLAVSELKSIPSFALTHVPFALDLGLKGIDYEIVSGSDIAVLMNGKITPTGYKTGTVTLRVWKTENHDYNTSNTVDITFEVTKGKPIIYFPNIANRTYKPDDTFELNAVSTSNEAITYIAKTSNISISGNIVTVLGAGFAEIEATLTGNSLYESAESVSQNFTIGKATQTLNFDAISNQIIGNSNVNLTASASSKLPVTFEVLEGQSAVTLSGQTLQINSSAQVKIRATQVGNDNYFPASSIEQTFEIHPTLFLDDVIVNTENYNLELTFTSVGNFYEGNQFIIELSETRADNLPINFLTTSILSGGIITAYIPELIAEGSNYKVRIMASSPDLFSNGMSILTTLYPKPSDPKITQNGTTLCADNTATSYQWYIRTENSTWQKITGATNKCLGIDPANSGRTEGEIQYAVQTFNGNRGSELSAPFSTTDFGGILANEDVRFLENALIYPNPTENTLNIEIDLKKSRNITLRILDKLGREITVKTIENSPIRFREQLNLESLAQGIYFLYLETENGTIVRKIVKE